MLLALLACTHKAPAPLVAALEVEMADGVGLAVDVLRPPGQGPAPTILIQTRYWRSIALKVRQPPDSLPVAPREDIARALLQAGYNVVVADVRGTGGSEGNWVAPWSPSEVADGCTLLDWIVHQPWSQPALGSYGTSYEGTTALLTATCPQPALRTVLARQVEWDLVDELVAPGGVANVAFPAIWSDGVEDLDHGRWPSFFPQGPRLIVSGPRPLDIDPGGELLKQQMSLRPARDVASALKSVRQRTDLWGGTEMQVGQLDPKGHEASLAQSKAAISIWASWWDGATADGALRALSALPQARVVIGAWDHEGEQASSPLHRRDSEASTVALSDVVDHFNARMKGEPLPPHRWFVAGAERWEEGQQLPTTQMRTLYLGPAGTLTDAPLDPRARELAPSGSAPLQRSEADNQSTLQVDFDQGVGPNNRWTAGLLRPIPPFSRRGEAGSLSWAAAPAALRLFGSAQLNCEARASAGEGALHAYLERLDLRGRATTITEGVARVGAGSLQLQLRAVALELKEDEGLGLTLTGADAGTFERLPAQGPNQIEPSDCSLLLPIRTDPPIGR